MERSMQRKVARSGAAASAANTGATPQGSPVSPRSLLLARSARNLDAVVAQSGWFLCSPSGGFPCWGKIIWGSPVSSRSLLPACCVLNLDA
eukprot:scaffold179898_cov19-Tisochrysis_lutea.AAC.1